MILNGVIALILHYFTEFDSFAGRLRLCSMLACNPVRLSLESIKGKYLHTYLLTVV